MNLFNLKEDCNVLKIWKKSKLNSEKIWKRNVIIEINNVIMKIK
jgi:hypothetical protein